MIPQGEFKNLNSSWIFVKLNFNAVFLLLGQQVQLKANSGAVVIYFTWFSINKQLIKLNCLIVTNLMIFDRI